jgi:hypothetical protein
VRRYIPPFSTTGQRLVYAQHVGFGIDVIASIGKRKTGGAARRYDACGAGGGKRGGGARSLESA